MIEEWKEIKGFEDYHISNLGRVKSFKIYTEGKILSLNMTKQGYYHVILYANKVEKGMKVHRLVATAFIPNPESKPQVNHIDGNKANNIVSNLEWNTASENQFHALGLGLSTSIKGTRHGMSKLTEEQVIDILNKGKYDTFSKIGKDYGVSRKTIEQILKREKWTHIEGYDPINVNIFNNKSSKLTLENIIFIRSSELSNSELAKILNVDNETIRGCRNYKTFKNIN